MKVPETKREGLFLLEERERSDLELILDFQGGDEASYTEIDLRYRPMAFRICSRYLNNRFDAEEATQETMVRVLQHLKRFNGRYALRPWVARIATNVCLDVLRAKSRRHARGDEPNGEVPDHPNAIGTAAGDPSELLERLVDREDVNAHLAKLPELHRIALVLREFEGLSHQEIAEAIGSSPARVKALLHRAKKGFRRSWDGNGHKGLGLLFPPIFLAPVNALKRLFGKVQDLDVVRTASAPTTQLVTTTGAERFSATVAAVMVAGTVGVAASGNSPAVTPRERPAEVVIVENADAGPGDRLVARGPDVRERRQEARKDKRQEAKAAAVAEAEVLPSPAPVTSPAPAEAAANAVSPAPAGEGEAEVEDVPRPQAAAPAPHPSGFEFGFQLATVAPKSCPSCGAVTNIAEDSVEINKDGVISFSQHITGALADASGRPAWALEVRQSGTASNHELFFGVVTDEGIHQFQATGTSSERAKTKWGGWTHTYHGTYEWVGGPTDAATAGLPEQGSYTAVLTFSVEQTRIVGANYTLD
jgi:RNA polymerase sigma-70 factor (ECF subfamily)